MAVGTKSSDVAVGGGPPASGRAALVRIGVPAQAASPGPKRVKVTVPVGAGVGAGPPVTVAVSRMGLPIVTGLVADVVIIASVDRATTEISFWSSQSPVTAGWLASPL